MFMFTSDHVNFKSKYRRGCLVTQGISFLNCYSLFDFIFTDLSQLSQEGTSEISKKHSSICYSVAQLQKDADTVFTWLGFLKWAFVAGYTFCGNLCKVDIVNGNIAWE